MARPKRTAIQREADRATIAAMYLKGVSQRAIARELDISQAQVSYDLACIQKEWKASAIRDFDAAKSEALAKIDNLERECWEQWERSKNKHVKETAKLVVGGNNPHEEVSTVEYEREGNVAYLHGVMACIDRRCKLLGLDAPVQANVNVTLAKVYHGFDPDLV